MSSSRKHYSNKEPIQTTAWSTWYDYNEGADSPYQARYRIKNKTEEWEYREPEHETLHPEIAYFAPEPNSSVKAAPAMSEELSSNYGATFGRMLSGMQIYPTKNSPNDCVVTSLAQLLHMTREDIYSYWPEYPFTKPEGINLGEIEQLLYRLPGLKRIIGFPFTKSPSNGNPRYLFDQQHEALTLLRKWLGSRNKTSFAFGYERESGKGHCIVGRLGSGQKGNRLDHYEFVDYQKGARKGLQILKEIKSGFLRFAILLDSNKTPDCLEMTLDDSRYQDPDDKTNCVQVHFLLDHTGICSAVYEPRFTASK